MSQSTSVRFSKNICEEWVLFTQRSVLLELKALPCWNCIKLVQLLDSCCVKVEVAKSFAAISRFPANTAAIATSGCLQPLLNLMVEATDPTVKIACAQALGNLAEHREARALITSQPSNSNNSTSTQDATPTSGDVS